MSRWLLVGLALLCVGWPFSRVIRQQVALSHHCAAGQVHDIRGQCHADPCNGVGAFDETRRECDITEVDRHWLAVAPGVVQTADGSCPSGYLRHPGLAGICATPALITQWQGNQPAGVRLNPEQAAAFNAQQQTKRDVQDAVREAVRSENRRERLLRGEQ